jgi:large subunit ribosomal protein L6
MSRVAKMPITVPKGVDVTISEDLISVKGSKGSLQVARPASIGVELSDGQLKFSAANAADYAMAGTLRSLTANTIQGVSEGFSRKLDLVGVGYRATMQGNQLHLALGMSHPVVFNAPDGISIEVPTQTEVLIKGADKQQVGQVAAKIRAFRPPEPYKGKGIRYNGEKIQLKEAKKA